MHTHTYTHKHTCMYMHTSTYTHMRRFIESSKSRPLGSLEAQQSLAVAVYVYDRVLKLMHPFMPFVTEELWQALPHTGVVCVPVCACVCVCLSACVCVYVYVHVRSCACIRVREFVLCTQSLGTASFAAQRLHVVNHTSLNGRPKAHASCSWYTPCVLHTIT